MSPGRFRSPLIEPDVRISRIRLSDQVHSEGMHDGSRSLAWPSDIAFVAASETSRALLDAFVNRLNPVLLPPHPGTRASSLPGFGRFVTSRTSGIATRPGRPLPGQDFHLLEQRTFHGTRGPLQQRSLYLQLHSGMDRVGWGLYRDRINLQEVFRVHHFMKKRHLILLLLAIHAPAAMAQTSAFQFTPGKLESGTVYHYDKSNIDGTHSSRIALYLSSRDEVESFKYHEGATEATLVKATMDWESFTVKRFESWRLSGPGDDVLRAILERVEGQPNLAIQIGDQKLEIPILNWPWHSYDFDFASLGLTFRFLVNPDAPFTIGIADVNRGGEGPPFHDKGTVVIEPVGIENHHGTSCRVYTIDGPGLENRGGKIWVDEEAMHIVDYEIDLPDEPGFDSGKLLLRSIEKLTPEEWEQFKADRIATGTRNPHSLLLEE